MKQDLMEKIRTAGCPCYCTASGTCSVSRSVRPVSLSCLERFCSGENCDSCPLLLAHLLRHSESAAGSYSNDLLTK